MTLTKFQLILVPPLCLVAVESAARKAYNMHIGFSVHGDGNTRITASNSSSLSLSLPQRLELSARCRFVCIVNWPSFIYRPRDTADTANTATAAFGANRPSEDVYLTSGAGNQPQHSVRYPKKGNGVVVFDRFFVSAMSSSNALNNSLLNSDETESQ